MMGNVGNVELCPALPTGRVADKQRDCIQTAVEEETPCSLSGIDPCGTVQAVWNQTPLGSAMDAQAPDASATTASVQSDKDTAPSDQHLTKEASTGDDLNGPIPKQAEVPSTARGIIFHLCRNNSRPVLCEVRRDETLLASFPITDTSERAIGFRLASLALPYPSTIHRDLDAARLLANSAQLTDGTNAQVVSADPEQAATQMLSSPNIIDLLRADLIRLGFRADPHVGIALCLCKLSALLDEPVYVYLVGGASSLKTSYADITARLMPPEFCKHLTELTKKALYYGQPDLAHHGVFLDELDVKSSGAATDLKVLRELYSKGWVSIEVTVGGKTEHKTIRGPVCVVQTTTAVEFDEQDISRRLVIDLPDDPERTGTVLTMMGEKYAGKSAPDDLKLITEVHRSIHRMLPVGCEVVVPYAPSLSMLLPRQHMTVLRAFRTMISLIKASALLHIRHREMDDNNRVIASLDDYRLVYEVAGGFVARSMNASGLVSSARKWVEALIESLASRDLKKAETGASRELAELERLGRDRFLSDHRRWDQWLGIQDLEELTGRPRTTVQRYLAQLEQSGLLDQQRDKRKITYRLATASAQLPTCPGLPTPEEVEREHLGSCRKCCIHMGSDCPPAAEQKEGV